jgi:tetratricopeptide (TPR) repeat protein
MPNKKRPRNEREDDTKKGYDPMRMGITLPALKQFLSAHRETKLLVQPGTKFDRDNQEQCAGNKVRILTGEFEGSTGTAIRCVDFPEKYEVELDGDEARSPVLSTTQMEYRYRLDDPNSTVDQVRDMIKRKTINDGKSMIEHILSGANPSSRKGIGKANVFVSFAQLYKITIVIEALENFVCIQKLDPDSTFFFIDVFAIRQHKDGNIHACHLDDVKEIADLIGEIGHTVLILDPWHSPIVFKRAWCLFEVIESLQKGAKLTLALSTQAEKELINTLTKHFDDIQKVMNEIDVREAKCFDRKDAKSILGRIESEYGFAEMNALVISALRDWLTKVSYKALEKEKNDFGLMSQVGSLLLDLGRRQEALPLLEQALQGREATLKLTHPDMLDSMSKMGRLLHEMGRVDEALPFLKKALEGRQATLEPTHPDTLASKSAMARLLQDRGQAGDDDCQLARAARAEALKLHRQVLEGRKATLGGAHPDTLLSVDNTGTVLMDMGRVEEALVLFKRTVEEIESTLGPMHPSTLRSVSSLSNALVCVGRLEEALPLLKRALKGTEASLRPMHPDTLTSVRGVGVVLMKMGRQEEALPLLKRVLEGREAALGATHPHTLQSVSNMGTLLMKMGRVEEGRSLLKRSGWF